MKLPIEDGISSIAEKSLQENKESDNESPENAKVSTGLKPQIEDEISSVEMKSLQENIESEESLENAAEILFRNVGFDYDDFFSGVMRLVLKNSEEIL